MTQSKKYEVEENQQVIIGEKGGKVPKSYQVNQQVCTYVDSATYAFYGSRTRDGLRASSTYPPTDRDKPCLIVDDCTATPDNRTSVHCILSGAASNRIMFSHVFAITTKSDFAGTTRNRFHPGKPFSPAGHNPYASYDDNVAVREWNASNLLVSPIGAFYNVLGAKGMPNATWCDSFGTYADIWSKGHPFGALLLCHTYFLV